MRAYKILFLNLGYARGISGRLADHVRYAHRHIYCPPVVQKQSLDQLNALIESEKPDICCFVEIDQGSPGAMKFNQLDAVRSEDYAFSDIENKYGRNSFFRSFGPTSGNSNAFIAREDYKFEKLFFKCGVKRLIYKIRLNEKLTLFFAHFSLQKNIRAQQILEARGLLRQHQGEAVFLGDFNVLTGLGEIEPLLDGGRYTLLNRSDLPTFFFHRRERVLDLCVCPTGMAGRAELRVLPQAYTDHAALMLDLKF